MATLRIVCCSAPEDKKLTERLYAHLRVLEFQHTSIWYAHHTSPSAEWERERDSQLQSAHLILFLVSSDFLNSRERYEKIVLPAMERYKRGETHVVPIILRPVYWQEAPFGKLQPLPEGGKPVTDPGWTTLDHALFDVVCGIKRVIDDEKLRILAQQENGDPPLNSSEKSTSVDYNAVAQLEQILQGFKSLRKQIADAVSLKMPQGFSVENCESRYNRLYGDTMVLLATYLPQSVSGNGKGFVEAVYRKAITPLQQRNNFAVWLTRLVITPLAELEKVAAQVDACVATLELYKQDYFMAFSQEATEDVSQSFPRQHASDGVEPERNAKPTNIRVVSRPSREGNRGLILFVLDETEHALEYIRYDHISHQILFLKEKQRELVRLVVPFATLKPLEKQAAFQIDGVDCLLTFKMSAVTSIMTIKVEVGGVEVFRN